MAKQINEHLTPLKYKITITYKTMKTLNYFHTKDRIPADLASNIVYQYECSQCSGHVYTGESVRNFITRKNEHLSGRPTPSEVSLHEHPLSENYFSIKLKTVHTKIGEALVYNTVPRNLRLNNNIPPFTLKVFTEFI